MVETDPAAARKHIVAAERQFQRLLPPEHQVFAAIQSCLAELPAEARARETWFRPEHIGNGQTSKKTRNLIKMIAISPRTRLQPSRP